MFKRVICLFSAVIVFSTAAFAHPGRLDSNGGHRDNRNVSGLGYYHYHCWGYPAHLHPNGVCPYRSGKKSVAPKKKSYTTNKSKAVVSPKILNFDGNAAQVNTVIKNGVSLMEVRSFANAIGAGISFENGAIRIYSNDNARSLYLYPNSANARTWSANGSNDVVLPMKVQNINGRTYIPARSLVEELGYSISFDGVSYSVGGAKKMNQNEVYQEPYKPTENKKYTPSKPEPPKSDNADMYYSKFRYKDKKADILMIYDGENYLIDIKGFADLCGLQSKIEKGSSVYMGGVSQSVEKLKNGEKTPAVLFMDNSTTYVYYDLQSHENKYLQARARARMIGSIFFAPSIELMYELGLEVEYDEKDELLEIKEI